MKRNTDKPRLIREAILNDSYLRHLNDHKNYIHSMIVPIIILNLDVYEFNSIYQPHHEELLSSIDILIDLRIEQIKKFYED